MLDIFKNERFSRNETKSLNLEEIKKKIEELKKLEQNNETLLELNHLFEIKIFLEISEQPSLKSGNNKPSSSLSGNWKTKSSNSSCLV